MQFITRIITFSLENKFDMISNFLNLLELVL